MVTSDPESSASRPAPPSRAGKVSAYETIKHAILAGDLAAGQPLVELNLAEWCGVSRTPIREALRRLEQDGLVERDAHGLIVRERSPEEILDLYDTRIVLEAMAARVAAERRTDYDVRQLRWLLQRGQDADAGDPARMVQANQQLHQAVWRASHNESLIDLLERLALHLARYPETTLVVPGRWEAARHQHVGLVDAIEAMDADNAFDIARQHFLDARDIRLNLFAAEPG